MDSSSSYTLTTFQNEDVPKDVVEAMAEIGYEEYPHLEKAYHQETAEEDINRVKNGKSVLIIARDINTDDIVAYASLDNTRTQTQAELGKGIVRKEHRRRGIYESLVKAREKIAREMGFESLIVHPANDGNSERVLRRLGFVTLREDEIGQVDLIKFLNVSSKEQEHVPTESNEPGIRQ